MTFNDLSYFAYSYIGLWLVPYVNWCLRDAIKRDYQTLYFISRDGHYLKLIADTIIKAKGYKIKTKYIYGSRKAWRYAITPDKLEELYTSVYGVLGGIKTFDELVEASLLDENKLLEMIPAMSMFKFKENLNVDDRKNIGQLFISSKEYLNFIQNYCKEKLDIVSKYIKQELNINEKFAFVEFWGRGYSQDLLTELLQNIYKQEITNPYYYARCFYNSNTLSIRHKFTQRPVNLAFIEPVFNTTSYQSIVNYFADKDGIYPEIIENENTFYKAIQKSLNDFTNDYIDIFSYLTDEEIELLDRSCFEHSVNYYLRNPHDQFICDVYSEFNYGGGMYEEIIKFAPKITNADIENLPNPIQTYSLPISLARSDAQIRKSYQEYFIKNNQKVNLPLQKQNTFPVNDLNNYINTKRGSLILALKEQAFMFDTSWRLKSNIYINKFELCTLIDVVFSNTGVPRLLCENGLFLTANKDWVQNVDYSSCLKESSQLALTDIVKESENYIIDNIKKLRIKNSKKINVYKDKFLVNKISPAALSLQDIENKVFDVEECFINKDGIPVIKLEFGYLPSLKKNVSKVRKDIENYFIENAGIATLKESMNIYSSVDFIKENIIRRIAKNTKLIVVGVSWTAGGTPRLKTNSGFITANKKFIGFI